MGDEGKEAVERPEINIEEIPDSIKSIMANARESFAENKPPRSTTGELTKLLVAAEEADRDDLVARIKTTMMNCGIIQKLWDKMNSTNGILEVYISYDELSFLDPSLQKEDFDAMIKYNPGFSANSYQKKMLAKDALGYLDLRKRYEPAHIVAEKIGKNLNRPVEDVKRHLRFVKKSSALRDCAINLGSLRGKGSPFYLISKSRIADVQTFIQKKFEAEERESVPSLTDVPENYVHIEIACEQTGITYSELIRAAKEGKILHAAETRGKSVIIHFDPISLEEYVTAKKQRRSTTAIETNPKPAEKLAPKKIEPANDESIVYNNFYAPVEINNGPIPIERILENSHFLTENQLRVIYNLTHEQVGKIIASGKLKHEVLAGKTRYCVANWFVENLRRALNI
ncbi:hypothetical protein KY325_01730 [Candidatus Woesearchaeota archaeon]|nr:hypothetical protein [Candidatus Woesearchaeota archaeon]